MTRDAHPDVTAEVAWRTTGTVIVACTSRCPAGGWCAEHHDDRHGIALPVAGAWRRRTGGREHFVSPAAGFFRRAGEVTQVAHFADEVHTGTIVDLDPDLTGAVIAETADATGPFVVTPEIHSAHRLLVASLRAPTVDDLDLDVRTLALVAAVVQQRVATFGRRTRRGTTEARRRVAHLVCERLHHDGRTSLVELARAVHYSPFHLSRVFREEIGTTLSAYRQSLRLHDLLKRLEGGEGDLQRLAVDAGFADHSHMTRTLVARLGRTPSALRTELTRCAAGA